MLSWGSNHNGTIGNGSFTPTLVASPVAIPGLDNVVQVEGGDRAGYAVLANGEVRAWGFNGVGELGNGTIGSPSSTPVSPLSGRRRRGQASPASPSSHPIGNDHVVARRSDGTVVAWGENGRGRSVMVRPSTPGSIRCRR